MIFVRFIAPILLFCLAMYLAWWVVKRIRRIQREAAIEELEASKEKVAHKLHVGDVAGTVTAEEKERLAKANAAISDRINLGREA